jgi:hypothetical protein
MPASAPADEIDKAETEFRTTLSEVTALIERLRGRSQQKP